MTTATPTTAAATTSSQRGAAPLTTVFTTPDFCAPLYWQDTVTPALSSSICMPPNFQQYWVYKWGFYSPGICPTGYTEGCAFPSSLAISDNGTPFYGGPIVTGETARICCPTGYTCLTGTAYSYSKCISTESWTTYWTTDYSNSVKQTTELATVFGLQVRWRESDLSILETDPTVPGSTYSARTSPVVNAGEGTSAALSAAITPAPTAVVAPTSDGNNPTSSSGGLTHTTTIAIAVAVPVISLILGSLAFLIWHCFYKRRQQRIITVKEEAKEATKHEAKSYHDNGSSSLMSPLSPLEGMTVSTELDATSVRDQAMSSTLDVSTNGGGDTLELDSTMRTEMEAVSKAQELPAEVFIAELPGSMPAEYEQQLDDEEFKEYEQELREEEIKEEALRAGWTEQVSVVQREIEPLQSTGRVRQRSTSTRIRR